MSILTDWLNVYVGINYLSNSIYDCHIYFYLRQKQQ